MNLSAYRNMSKFLGSAIGQSAQELIWLNKEYIKNINVSLWAERYENHSLGAKTSVEVKKDLLDLRFIIRQEFGDLSRIQEKRLNTTDPLERCFLTYCKIFWECTEIYTYPWYNW